MSDNSGAKLGLKPRGLGRHNLSRIGNAHKVLDRDRIKGEGDLEFTRINQLLQLGRAPYPPDKIYTLVPARIPYAQYRIQKIILQYAHVKALNGIFLIKASLPGRGPCPLPFKVDAKGSRARGYGPFSLL